MLRTAHGFSLLVHSPLAVRLLRDECAGWRDVRRRLRVAGRFSHSAAWTLILLSCPSRICRVFAWRTHAAHSLSHRAESPLSCFLSSRCVSCCSSFTCAFPIARLCMRIPQAGTFLLRFDLSFFIFSALHLGGGQFMRAAVLPPAGGLNATRVVWFGLV